jgi:hypothetical protein
VRRADPAELARLRQRADGSQDLADATTKSAARARHEARWTEHHPADRMDRFLGRLGELTRRADRLRDRVEHVVRVAGQEWARTTERDGS